MERSSFGHTQLPLRVAVGGVLRNQHLVPEAAGSDIVGVSEDVVGLHATRPTTPYLSLFARVPDFRREHLEHELYVARTQVRLKCMRGTVFIVPKSAVATLFAATRRANEANQRRYLTSRGVAVEECELLAPRILETLRGRELTVRQIRDELGTIADVSSAVGLLCDRGTLVRTRSAHGWRDASNAYALMEEWLPDVELGAMGEEEAVASMVRSYIGAYGPVAEGDIAWWAGLPKRSVHAVLAELEPELARFEVSGLDGTFIMLRSRFRADEDAALPEGGAISFLPVLDPYVMGYKQRARYLDPEVADRVFDRGGNATSTIFLDGRIIGVWDAVEQPAPAVWLHLFAPGNDDLLARLRERARLVGTFLFGEDVEVRQFARMKPLTNRPTGAYSPLREAAGARAL